MSPSLGSSISAYKRVVGADPAANSECLLTVPTGKQWWVLSVTVALVQGGAGASQPILIIDDGANTLLGSPGTSSTQAISTTCQYTWAQDLALSAIIGSGAACFACAPLPDGLLLGGGFRIRTSTIGLSANTDYGVPAAYVAEIG